MPPTKKTYGSLNPLLNIPVKPAPVQGPVQTPVTVPTQPKPTTPKAVATPVPVVTPTVPVVPAPTPATTYGPDLSGYNPTDEYDTALAGQVKNNKFNSEQTISPEKIYQQKLKQYQKEIDAVNQIYAQKINTENLAGQGRLGSGRAIQGRSGLLGSDFASAQNDSIGQYNSDVVGGIRAQQQAAIQTILGNARKDANEEAAAKTLAKQQGADAYLKFLGEQSTRRSSKLESFLSTLEDTDVSKLNPTNLAEVAKSYGISADELKTKIKASQDAIKASAAESDLKTRKSEADIAKIEADIASGKLVSLSEGNKLYNTETGEVVAYNPKTYAPSSSNTGPLYGGYNDDQNKVITRIDDKVSKNATYAKTSNMRGYADNVNASLAQGTGTGDLAAINQFQKVIDEGAVTRDQDVKLIQGSQSLANRLATQVNKLQKGQQLSPTLRSEMKNAVNLMYEAQIKALAKDPFITSKKAEVERYGIRPEDTILGELGAFSTQNTVQPTGDPEYDAYLQSIGQ